MAGGTWLSQNKVRPGAYINFEGVAQSSMTVGDRGIVTLALPLHWGAEGSLIEVLSTDMLGRESKKAVGFNAYSADSKLLAAALKYCYKALVYRTNKGGTKASATVGSLTATAKYAGTYGNNINIAITNEPDDPIYRVITYVEGETVDTQSVTTIAELVSNDYVDFSGTGTFTTTAGTPLANGADGTESEDPTEYFNLLSMANWQTLGVTSTNTTFISKAVNFIKSLREDSGRYVQGVVANYDLADYEGIINSVNGAVIDGVTFQPHEFVAIVAGMTAGAQINESNTARTIEGATAIISELSNDDIIKGLNKGHFMLSTSASGRIKVEQDINSLHTFTNTKGYAFSKNRVIRTIDEIGTTTCVTWEDSYMGKVNNNDEGRSVFLSDLIAYGEELARIEAITDFDSSEDITVERGDDVDSVLVTWTVRPVDSMEKLYMTVMVDG